MKLFELIPKKITDILPPLLNKEIPPPIDQVALRFAEATKMLGFAGIGLAIKTRNLTKETISELITLGKEAMGVAPEKTNNASNTATPQEITTEVQPAEPTKQDRFTQASIDIKYLTKKPDNATLGELYAFYKQATEGDATGKRPGITKVTDRFKFDAWSRKKGLSGNDAQQAYIDKVTSLLAITY